MSFVIHAFVLGFYLVVVGGVLIYIGGKFRPQLLKHDLTWVFVMLGLAFVGASLWISYSAAAYTYDEAALPPCEHLLNETRTVDGVTTYHYIDSCAARPGLAIAEANAVIYGGVLLVLLVVVSIFVLMAGWLWLVRRW